MSQIELLREQYKSRFSKQPFNGWDEAKLQQELSAKPLRAFATKENAQSVQDSYTAKGIKTRIVEDNNRFVLLVK